MLNRARRLICALVGALILGIVAVACTGTARAVPLGPNLPATFGGLTVQLPSAPFQVVGLGASAPAQTVTQSQAALRNALHAGEESSTGVGCPLALPR